MKRSGDKRNTNVAKPVVEPVAATSPSPGRRRWFWILSGLAFVSVSLGFGSWSYQATERSKTYTSAFVGRSTCASCHAAEAQKFAGSHHDLAMDLATPTTIIDPKAFDDQEFTEHGITSKFFRKGDKYFVTTDGPTGEMETFEVKYVFGVDPLQQYMVEFPDKKKVRNPQGQEIELPAGRIQVLTIAWDTQKHRWFHLQPKQKYPAGDWLHWTGGGMNWNYMCADCHSTDLKKNYDFASNSYHTTYSEIDVSCEACHGPAGEHVTRAQSTLGFNDPRHFHSYAIGNLKAGTSLAEIDSCAPCHSRRRIVHGDYRHGSKFLDFYEPSTLEGDLYHADGQIREELYEYGSFLQSRMFREGVKCSNCHDPHSLKPKFEGNKLCTQCHVPAQYDVPAHHHHKLDSAGAKCVECHMPETTYMEVDPRRDHSIRIPRPDLTKKLGTPNACANCHKKPEESTDWLAAKVVEWYGPKRSESTHFGETLEAGRRGDPHAAAGLIDLAKPKPTVTKEDRAAAVGPVVRASAVALLARYGDPAAETAIDKALRDADPLVQVAALRALESRGDEQLAPFRTQLFKLLDDPTTSVRTEAARGLARIPPQSHETAQREKFERVFQAWVVGQRTADDRAEAHTNIGSAYTALYSADDYGQALPDNKYAVLAEAEYRAALRLDPTFIPALRYLAVLQDMRGRDDDAERLFREGLELVPKLDQPEAAKKRLISELEYQLGWLLAREPQVPRREEALEHFERCLALDPANAEALRNKGSILLALDRFTDGAAALKRFCLLRPDQTGLLLSFAGEALQNGQKAQAAAALKVLLEVDPDAPAKYPQLQQLLRRSSEP